MGEILVRNDFSDLYERLKQYDSVYMVYDSNVEGFADEIAGEANIQACMSIDADGANKNMDTVLDICRFLLALGADRKALVLAVGGGTTTDIVGFAASIYKRGVKFAFVPTTLLAQVDASIGGKTGVNLDSYKNIIGTFSLAEFTYSCVRTLSTLTQRDLVSGYAEMLKSFIICSSELYEKAVALLPSITPENVSELSDLIDATQKFKVGVVERDPYEAGERKCLNLGHTYGHAVEWWEQTHECPLEHTHGEAVAIGLVKAAELSEQKGFAQKGLAAKIAADLSRCGLPTELPCPEEELAEALTKDKKNVGGKVKFVYIREIGKVEWSV